MLIVIAAALFYLFPLARIFSMSFMSASELYAAEPSILPRQFTVENYVSIFEGNIPIFTFLKNTVVMALLITAVQLVVSSITAYALTELDLPFKKRRLCADPGRDDDPRLSRRCCRITCLWRDTACATVIWV